MSMGKVCGKLGCIEKDMGKGVTIKPGYAIIVYQQQQRATRIKIRN